MCNLNKSLVCTFADGAFKPSQIEWHESIDSTNRRGKEALSACPDISCIAASAQREGKGTRDRSFYSPDGTGLYMSYLHRGEIPPARLYRITPLAAVAVRRALADCGVAEVGIKWVNDLVLGGKKICGILTEPWFEDGVCRGAVIGIGINLTTLDFPPELTEIATSIKAETGLCLTREEVMGRVMYHLRTLLGANDDSDAMREYRTHSILIGRTVTVRLPTESYQALVLDIDRDGGLLLRLPSGKETVLRAGGVSLSVQKQS